MWLLQQVYKHKLENASLERDQLDAQLAMLAGRMAVLEARRALLTSTIDNATAALAAVTGGRVCPR